MENRNLVEETADKLLSKYVSVWLWSILFGTNVGLAYSSMSYYSPNKWGPLGLLLVLLLALALLASLMSWLNLLRYLSGYLIPKFFNPQSVEDCAVGSKYAVTLRKALSFMIVAFLARGCVTLIELLYSSLFES